MARAPLPTCSMVITMLWSEPCSQPAEGNNYVLVGALLPAYPKVMTSTGSSPAPCSGPSAASPGTLPQTAINSIHLTLTVEHTVHNTDIRLYLTYLNVPKSHSKKKPGRNIKKKTFILKPILTTDLVLKKKQRYHENKKIRIVLTV